MAFAMKMDPNSINILEGLFEFDVVKFQIQGRLNFVSYELA